MHAEDQTAKRNDVLNFLGSLAWQKSAIELTSAQKTHVLTGKRVVEVGSTFHVS